MKKNILVTAILIFLLSIPALSGAQNAWVKKFTPLRTFYVSPTGTGSGISESTPMSLSAAQAQALPGDLYVMLTGNYGTMTLTRSGTAANPIVWRSKRLAGALHDRVTILNGRVIIQAQHNWVWGIEVTATAPVNTATGGGSGVLSYAGTSTSAVGSAVINSYLHDLQISAKGPVVGFWNHGIDRLLYGNIIGPATVTDANSHLIYGQNLHTNYVYVVHNQMLDARDTPGAAAFSLHLYSDGNDAVRYMHVEKNIAKKGRVIIGEGGTHSHHIVQRKNIAYDIAPWRTHKRPMHFEFTDNYLGFSGFECGMRSNDGSFFLAGIWGPDSGTILKPGPNIFKRNTIVKSNLAAVGWDIQLRAIAFVNSVITQPANLDPIDQWDNNIYDTNFRGRLSGEPGDTLYNNLSFAQWKTMTASLGATNWDANSTIISPPTTAKVFLFANEYDAGRGNLAIFNWGLAPSVPVNIAQDSDTGGTVIAVGQGYKIVKARDFWGPPVLSGTYNGGTVNVPIAGNAEFASFVVLATTGTSGSDPNPPAPPQNLSVN